MFSRKTAFLIGIVLFVATSFTILTVSSRYTLSENGVEQFAVSLISPFQTLVSSSFIWCNGIWKVYFNTVSAAEENNLLKSQLALAVAAQNRCRELELENNRLRKFISFSNDYGNTLVAAKVIGRDPSPWFQTLMINKGAKDGLVKGLPVLVAEGVVGQLVDIADKFSRILLITDRNSAVDALVQNSRARGIVQGNNTEQCLFKYALRKDEIRKGDIIISSGLDQVFPKGLRIGEVIDLKKEKCDLFQMIFIRTFVDFDKLEEVLVSVKPAPFERTTDIYVENEETTEYQIDLQEQPKKATSQQSGMPNHLKNNMYSNPEHDLPYKKETIITQSIIKKSAKNTSVKPPKPSMKESNLQKKKDEQKKRPAKEEQ